MAAPCGGDPVACIDFVMLFIVEFLKDWTTMAMLAVLLGLLLKLRAGQRKAAAEAYALQIGAYEERRSKESGQLSTWRVEDDADARKARPKP